VSEDNLVKNYRQIRNELKKYSNELIKKDELIVFNKVDLIDNDSLKKKVKEFEKKVKRKVLSISTLDKKLISVIKSKLLKYVS
jgi:GTP-binding protein